MEWFRDPPDGVWIVAILIGSAAAIYETTVVLVLFG
jgi:hypothetical protein